MPDKRTEANLSRFLSYMSTAGGTKEDLTAEQLSDMLELGDSILMTLTLASTLASTLTSSPLHADICSTLRSQVARGVARSWCEGEFTKEHKAIGSLDHSIAASFCGSIVLSGRCAQTIPRL